MSEVNDRISWGDKLRIVACLGVIVLHASVGLRGSISSDRVIWSIGTVLDALVRWSVPVFIMLSGYFMLSYHHSLERLYKHNIFRVVICFICCSFIYAVIEFALGDWSVKGFIYRWIVGPVHLWFLYLIVALYILTPLLEKIVEDRKLCTYFLLISFAAFYLLPAFISSMTAFGQKNIGSFERFTISNMNVHLSVGHIFYYVLGFYIGKYDVNHKKLIYFLSVFGFLFTAFGALSIGDNFDENIILGYNTINVCFEAVGVFLLFKDHTKNAVKSEASKGCMGVYLFHPIVLRILKYIETAYVTRANIIALVILNSIVAFVLCSLITYWGRRFIHNMFDYFSLFIWDRKRDTQ